MRAGPLSNSKVIAMLNRYYVPVYSSNEYAGPEGTGPAEERNERDRIFTAFEKARLGTGDVRVYLLAPDGAPVASVDLGRAMNTEQLLGTLEQVVKKLGTQAGDPLVKPRPQSAPPAAAPGALLLHLSARAFNRGSWGEFPGENWIVLSAAEAEKLLPQASAGSWQIDPAVSRKLLTNFYPQTEDISSADRNRIELQSLRGTVISASGDATLAKLEGSLKMKRSFYPGRDDYKPINATLVGFLEFSPAAHRVESMALVTEKASYGDEEFGAGMHSVSSAPAPEK